MTTTQERTTEELQDLLDQMTSERDALADSVDQLNDQLSAEQTRVADLIREKSEAEVKLDKFWEDLADEADRRDWCSEYDTYAVTHGGPSRHGQVEAYCQVTVTTRLADAGGLDADDLHPQLGIERLGSGADPTITRFDTTVVWSFAMPAQPAQARRGHCACGSMDWHYFVRQHLINHSIPYVDYSIEPSCENCC